MTITSATLSGHNGAGLEVNGVKVVGEQGAAVPLALTAGSATAALNAAAINLVIARLIAHGMIAPNA